RVAACRAENWLSAARCSYGRHCCPCPWQWSTVWCHGQACPATCRVALRGSLPVRPRMWTQEPISDGRNLRGRCTHRSKAGLLLALAAALGCDRVVDESEATQSSLERAPLPIPPGPTEPFFMGGRRVTEDEIDLMLS